MSKTVGNVIDPFELIKKYGADSLRYYFLREIPSVGDGDFSEQRFKELYNADLANGLGNLIARVAKLCEQSKISFDVYDSSKQTLKREVKKFLDKFDFFSALHWIWRSEIGWGIRWLDQDINNAKPWKIHDQKLLETKLILYVLTIRDIAFNLQPFLPQTAEKILAQFKGPTIQSAPPLFPRI